MNNLIPRFLFLFLFAQAVCAQEAYFHLPLNSLSFAEGNLPPGAQVGEIRRHTATVVQLSVVLDGEGEAYVDGGALEPWGEPRDDYYRLAALAIRVPTARAISGRLFVPKTDLKGMVVLKFQVPAAKADATARKQFLQAKEAHYRRLRAENIPGTAWFRHQQDSARIAQGGQSEQSTDSDGRFPSRPPSQLEDTYELFSGGRAISENLQLNRALAGTKPGESTVEISSLTGVTVQEMNWKPLVQDIKPQLDRLAAAVPADQHAIFFPTFRAMTEMMDEADTHGTPVLQLLEERSEDANVRGRYQKQLCLELNDISRLLGPQVISSVAFTGSDPYLRSGTDVGVLFETKSSGVLKAFLAARQAASQQADATIQKVSGEIEGVAYSGVLAPDRSVSSYLATVDEVVFVSNSLYQLAALVKTATGKAPSLAGQDEYRFFRHRYARDEQTETAFLVLSDATIRRWCSPRWRIANSRRTQVAAALAEAQAAHLDALVKGTGTPGPLAWERSAPEAGQIQLTKQGVVSSSFGTLDFLTPIAELPLLKVTEAEATAYRSWRNRYQENWRKYFDPIAVRFSFSARQLVAEVTVMPLIAGTDYRQFIEVTRGAHIAPGAGDPHPEALAHMALAVNSQSEFVQGSGNFLGSISPSLKANPLGWLGQSIALYADADPFWAKVLDASDAGRFLERNLPSLPVALHCEVKNALGLATFLTALRAYANQTAPNLTVWQSLEYKGQAYVKIAAALGGADDEGMKWAVYYSVTPQSLVLTLSESVLKRALDRQSVRAEAANGNKTLPITKPWLGTNVCLQLDQQFLGLIGALSRDEYRSAQQRRSWSNLPILNEWRRLYPNQDPIKLHENFWQTKLSCPGGGAYVWNEKWQTLESTVYGHPGEPKNGPDLVGPLGLINAANLGLSFENQGLSAKVVLERVTKKP